jgi:hypothetical protein
VGATRGELGVIALVGSADADHDELREFLHGVEPVHQADHEREAERPVRHPEDGIAAVTVLV